MAERAARGMGRLALAEARVTVLEARLTAYERALKTRQAIIEWALEQLRMWWRGNRRDMSRPDLALAELDRMERAALSALDTEGEQG